MTDKISNKTKILFIIIHFILALAMAILGFSDFPKFYVLGALELIISFLNLGVSIFWLNDLQ